MKLTTNVSIYSAVPEKFVILENGDEVILYFGVNTDIEPRQKGKNYYS